MAYLLATAGHIDHGKSALVRSLTGLEPDRLRDEKARGMTIELGFYPLPLAGIDPVSLIDVPGHEAFVRTMAAGVFAVDLALFVIACNEGIKPQTREHLDILNLLGTKRGVIVFTKVDLLPGPQHRVQLEKEAEHLVRNTFLEEAPRVFVSSQTGEGIEHVKDLLAKILRDCPKDPPRGLFRLWVDRSFTRPGVGRIVTGTSLQGTLENQTEVTLFPQKTKARIREMQVHGRRVLRAMPGERTALHLVGAVEESVARGTLISPSERILCTNQALTSLHWLRRGKSSIPYTLILGTTSATCKLRHLKGEDDTVALLKIDRPLPLCRGDRFLLRDTQPRIVGGGVILDIQPPFAHGEHLSTLRQGTEADAIAVFFATKGFFGLSAPDLLPWLAPEAHENLFMEQLCRENQDRYISLGGNPAVYALKQHLQKAREEIIEIVCTHQKEKPLVGGPTREEALHALKRLHRGMVWDHVRLFFDRVLSEMAGEGQIFLHQDRLQAHPPTLSAKDQQAADHLVRLLLESKWAPPTAKILAERLRMAEKELTDLLGYLRKRNVVTKISSDLYVESSNLEALKKKVLAHFQLHPELDVTAFKAISGLTRKHAIPYLEYFDRERVTLRVGEKRKLRRI